MATATDAQEDIPDHVFGTDPESVASGNLAAVAADDLTRAYVASILANPRGSLASAAARSSFVDDLLGDTSLAKEAHDDVLLMRQLESRAVILVRQVSCTVSRADDFVTDAFIALLAIVATRWPILLETLEQEGVTLIVVNAMRDYSLHAAIAARCLTALRAFAVTDLMRKRVMFDGGMDATLHLMTTHQHDHRVQDRAAAVIANVAFGCPHRKRRIARQGGVKKIIDGMNAFPDDESIQLRGALTIRNLTYEAQVNQYIAGNQGAVEAISATLLRFRGGATNPELRFQCVMALDSLCREDERNRYRLVELDSTVASIPQSSSSISPVASRRSDDPSKEHVNEDGDVVVDEEEMLLPDVTPNFRHGGALCPGRSSTNLVGSPSLSSSGESERIVESPSTVEAAAEGSHQENNAISNIDSPKQAEQPSLIRAIVHAMRRDPDDKLLLETGLSLLTVISLHRPTVQLRLGELGGIHLAVAAIRRHRSSEAVASKASALLRCLCLQEVNRGMITSGLTVLVTAMTDHSKNPQVIREVAAALGNAVFEHEKNRALVVNKAGVTAIVKGMNDCGDNDIMVLEAGVCTLRNFVDSSYEGALSAKTEGAILAAVAALNRTKDASSTGERIVQEQTVKLLGDIARLAPQALVEMKTLDVVDWIENALAKLSEDEYSELHVEGDHLIHDILNLEVNQPQGRSGRGGVEETATATERFSGRRFFNALFVPRRRKSRGDVGKTSLGRSMPIDSESNRGKRRSARFLKGSILS